MTCPKCGAPLQEIALDAGAKVLSCPSCAGAFYPRNELAVEIALSQVGDTERACPQCGGRLRAGTMYSGKLELEQCSVCGGVWLDAGEVGKLRSLSGVEGLLKGPAAGATFLSGGGQSEDIQRGVERFAPKLSENAPMSDKTGRLIDSATMDNPDANRAPSVTVDGVVYKHFQTAVAQVVCALGEFNWKVEVGEHARVRDFIAPPNLLSNEVTGKDSVWSRGRWLEGSEVWQAFQLEGSPPPAVKVAPAQPNHWSDDVDKMWTAYGVSAILALFIGIGMHAAAPDRDIATFNFDYDRAEAEKSKVSPEFAIDGRTSNLEVLTTTNLANKWAYFSIALINSETDEALDFGREVSYYYGSDSDGAWSEGAPYDRAVIPRVPPGRYYLRVEPEDGDAQKFSYYIKLRRGVPQWLPVFLVLLVLLFPPLIAYWRRYSFEVDRWAESDHPWVSEGPDDDDDDD